jgi:UDP-4-amino-4,6-dideoxy-N-acetyl-beta-L-altrosamine transaminase
MIPYGKHHIDENDIQAVVDILRSSFLTQGPAIEVFEKAVAEYVGVKFAVAVSSGTAALHLATLAAGVGPGSSVVTSPITFVASANAARYCGGDVLFTDIDSETVNMSPDALREVLLKNSNVKAIIPVHFAGLPCDMTAIKKLADDAGAIVIEDAAHALGATYPNGKRVGCCENSLMTIFSFHPVKAISAGEGGLITTNDEVTYRKLIRSRSHGINKLDDALQVEAEAFADGEQNPWYYEMQELGFHYRITDIQCGLALSQFNKLDSFISRRRDIVKNYDLAFAEMKNFCPAQITMRDQSGHHLYVLRINFKQVALTRGQVMKKLKEYGIGSQVHYIPVPSQPYYRQMGFKPEDYPNAQKYYQEALTIPLFYDLTEEQQRKVISTIKDLLG